jgi:diguanylate cyclase (GGDEF)-like protein/PAS domain S-box-containing protein
MNSRAGRLTRPEGRTAMLDDVTMAESLLRRSYAFERLGAAAAVLDGDGVIVETNEAWRLFAALNEGSLEATGCGVNYLSICDRAFAAGSESAAAVAVGLRAILRGERASFEVEYACPSPIEDRWFLLRASTAPVHQGAGVVLFHVNITARKQLEERFASPNDRDPATGLPDHRAGFRLIEQGLARAAVCDTRLSVIKMTVDGLGAVEDTFGLPAAEDLRVQLTARALRVLRVNDVVGQLGADSLIMVCADLDDDAEAGLVTRLQDAFAAPFQVDATQIALTVSVGVASNRPGSTAIGLLADATAADTPEFRTARLAQQRARAAARAPNDIRLEPTLPAGDETALPMRIARAQRDAVLAHSNDLVLYMELDGTIAWASPTLHTVLGVDPESLVGRHGFELIHPDDLERTLAELGTIVGPGDHATTEHRVVTDDGRIYWVEETVTNLVEDPNVGYIVANLHDITERKQLELDLLLIATHDALTGLPNRTLLLEQAHDAITTSALGDHVGVIVFDVDQFKLVNDSVGHDRGDQLLVAIAEALRGTLTDTQTAARFDGDAFAVVAPAITSASQALEVIDRLRDRLAAGLTAGPDLYRPTISAGIVLAKSGDTAITALRDAETAMYRAKEQGRDRIEWFDPSLHAKVIATFQLERDLREAIDNDQLSLVFQPVLDLETNQTTSCEALVRWQHPVRGMLSPDEFIPVAEETGLIIPLGRWVLRHALETATHWPTDAQVAVNLSAAELAEPDLVAVVKSTLTDINISARRLVLEITETAVIHDPTAASRTIAALRALGVGVVIDDFGTGYTSLSFLRDYRIDGLKIDRSFVAQLDNGSTAIVDAMLRMSRALGLKVVAEGIETTEQLEQLRALGCRFIQGYLISRPVAAEKLTFHPADPARQ